MKAIIKNGKLFDPNTGYEIQLNKRFLYEEQLDSFKSLADNSEIEINNCWRSEDIRSEECTILYGSSLAFSIKNAYSRDDVPDVDKYKQSLIDKETDLQGVEINDNTRDNSDAVQCSISSGSISSSVQDEHGTINEDAGNNQSEYQSNWEITKFD